MQLERIVLASALTGAGLAGAAGAQTPLLHVADAQPGGTNGWNVAAPGDLDGDGVPDVVLGAPWAVGPAGSAGAVRAYSGADTALLWETFGTASGDQFGHALAAVGDTDADGVADLVVGAWQNDDGGGASGSAYVLSGADGSVRVALPGDTSLDYFGYAVAGLGDLDADGAGDFAVAAPGGDSTGGPSTGFVRVFSGATVTPLGQVPGSPGDQSFGRAVAALGDVTGDGRSEIVVGVPGDDTAAPDAGRVAVFDGAGGALLYTWPGTVAGAELGASVAALGDVDGDGLPDFAAGAPSSDGLGLTGSVTVHSGGDGSLLMPPIPGLHAEDKFGWSVAGPGDLDGDGVPDVAVGAVFANGGGFHAGSVVLHSGATGAVLTAYDGANVAAQLGCDVVAAGDFNGDGTPDLLAGAFGEDAVGPFSATGAAWVFSGVDCPPTVYCTAKTNSQGCTPRIASTGVPLAAGARTTSGSRRRTS